MSFLTVHELICRRDGALIVPGISFGVARGAFACLLGPSGCGKTTLLRLLAGLEQPSGGEVRLGGDVLEAPGESLPPQRRGIGMVFQQPALFPTLSVARQVSFGLRGRKTGAARRERVAALLETIGLSERADALPHQLSGGQQHRVALARALAPSPRLLLLDEPFAHLDPALRQHLREQTRALAAREGVTCLMVTHDAAEAMQMGDTLLVMDATGHLRQQATAETVYRRPADAYVAQALGEINLLSAQSAGGVVRSVLGDLALADAPPGALTLGLRPHELELHADGVTAELVSLRCAGAVDRAQCRLKGGDMLLADLPPDHGCRTGETLRLRVSPGAGALFAAT